MKPTVLAFGALLALTCAAPSSVSAADMFAKAEPLPTSDLAKTRAGFINLEGVQFAFGVMTQTLVNGQVGLASQLVVNNTGAVSRSVNSDFNVTPSATGSSATVPGTGGSTFLYQSLSPTSIANVIATNASDQTIRQMTSVSLTLYGFDQNQASYARQSALSSINSALNFANLTTH